MAIATAPAAHASQAPPRLASVRTWFGAVGRRASAVVSAARLKTSPALTISGLATLDASAWTTFGHGAGLAAIGLSALIYDWSREKT